jgi:hypothetical protein
MGSASWAFHAYVWVNKMVDQVKRNLDPWTLEETQQAVHVVAKDHSLD